MRNIFTSILLVVGLVSSFGASAADVEAGKAASATCAGCHGADGNSAVGPGQLCPITCSHKIVCGHVIGRNGPGPGYHYFIHHYSPVFTMEMSTLLSRNSIVAC